MNQIEKEAYAKIINILFDGALNPTPEQITPEAVRLADEMAAQISTCHERIRPFSLIVNGIADSIYALMPNTLALAFGPTTWEQYFTNTSRDGLVKVIKDLFYQDAGKANAAAKVLEAFYDNWLKHTAKDRRMKMCIVTARVHWRSRIETEITDF